MPDSFSTNKGHPGYPGTFLRSFTISLIPAILAFVLVAHPDAAARPPAQPPAHLKPATTTKTRSLTERPADPARQLLVRRLRHLGTRGVLSRGITAVHIAYARTGKPLYAVKAKRPLNPASNVKLVSTATALAILGPRWRYVTLVLGEPPSPAGRVQGGLRLVGSGDPTLDLQATERLAAKLHQRGVRQIQGDVLLGPRLRVHLNAEQAADLLADAASDARSAGDPTRDSAGKSSRDGNGKAQGDREGEGDGDADHRASCTTSAATQTRVDPTDLGAAAFHRALSQAGIAVTGRVRRLPRSWRRAPRRPGDRELARHHSAVLAKLLEEINHPSDNRLAEAVLRTAGAVMFGGRLTRRKGVRAMRWWLRRIARVPLRKVRLENGSGLSTLSRLSPRQLTRVLRVALGYTHRRRELSPARQSRVQRDAAAYRESLPRAARDGTLQYRFVGSMARRYVRAKTGTLRGIITLSGVITPPGGRPVVFSILSNGIEHDERYFVRRRHEKMVEAIYRYLTR
jgi:D-alanyl-D-alanine carboxypeptidase/D-alanyl-D-alanine-endopeptidase (penicillin-binding protein 4)